MGWVRMNASWDGEKRHRRVGVFGRMALRAAVLLSKERDWQRAERRGWVPREEFDGEEVARHLEALGDAALARYMTPDQLLDELTAGIAACEAEGLLLAASADGWWIDGWETYVGDPTAAKRKADERARKRAAKAAAGVQLDLGGDDVASLEETPTPPPSGSSRDVTVTQRDARDVSTPAPTPVTVGHRDEPESFGAISARLQQQAGHGDIRDVTPHYVTERQQVANPPTPADAGAGGSRLRRLTAAELAVAGVVAEAVARGDVDLEPPADRREFEKRLGAAKRRIREATTAATRIAAEEEAKRVETEHGAARRDRIAATAALLHDDPASAWDVVMRWRNSDTLCGIAPHRVPLRVACSRAQRSVEQTERAARREAKADARPLPFVAAPALVVDGARKAANA